MTDSLTTIIGDHIEQQLRDMGENNELAPDDDLVELGLDSISYVRLIAFIETRFGLKVPDSDVTLDHFGTLAAIATYLDGRGATA